MPKLLGTAFSSAVVASKPPAEAPIPTTGNLLLPWDLDRSVSRCSAGVVPFSFIGASAPDSYWNGSILRHVTPPCEGLHTTHLPPIFWDSAVVIASRAHVLLMSWTICWMECASSRLAWRSVADERTSSLVGMVVTTSE